MAPKCNAQLCYMYKIIKEKKRKLPESSLLLMTTLRYFFFRKHKNVYITHTRLGTDSTLGLQVFVNYFKNQKKVKIGVAPYEQFHIRLVIPPSHLKSKCSVVFKIGK